MKLTDTLDEQVALERVLEETKPAVPEECRRLHYLLFTPFRYVPYPHSSRFRRAGSRDGVFYASEFSETAVAEAAFYRLLFFAESPVTPWPANPGEYTAFAAIFETQRGVDLTRPPLLDDRALWTRTSDYAACLALADVARAADLDVIRYESVRDPQRRANLALLDCRVFTAGEPAAFETWHLHQDAGGVRAFREAPAAALAFDRAAFAGDPRIAGMPWAR